MPSQGSCFVTHTFHQAAVTHNDIGVVVYKIAAHLIAQVRLGNCHTYCISKALTQRTCGDFYA